MRRSPRLALLLAVLCAAAPAMASDEDSCRLDDADLLANRALAWRDFDQAGSVPTSWRALVERGCDEEAVRAYTDYLAYGPVPEGERWQTTARFHLGQSLANAGRHEQAAQLIATARRQTEIGEMRWNLYVQGTYAFLVRDRSALEVAFESLKAEPGRSNAVNAGVLAGLLSCWDKPYREASAPACVAASGYRMPADK